MADKFVQYITIEGQGWDSVAQACYGDPMRMLDIAAANKDVPLYDLLPGGIRLQVPVIETEQADTSNLPPWKR